MRTARVADLVVRTSSPGLSIVPVVHLARRSRGRAGARCLSGERRLARILADLVARYDYIILDCPPSLGLLTVNALTAADAVVIPIQCEYYALEGLSQLIATINLVRNHLNPDLAIKGVVLTMYDPRTNLSAEVDAEVRKYLGSTVFETIIPRSVRLSESPSYGLPIACIGRIPRARRRTPPWPGTPSAGRAARLIRIDPPTAEARPKRFRRGVSSATPSGGNR